MFSVSLPSFSELATGPWPAERVWGADAPAPSSRDVASIVFEGSPVEGGPVEGGPVEGGPVEGGPVEGGPVEGGPVEGDPVEGDPVEGDTAGGDSVESDRSKEAALNGGSPNGRGSHGSSPGREGDGSVVSAAVRLKQELAQRIRERRCLSELDLRRSLQHASELEGVGGQSAPRRRVFSTGIDSLDAALPDHGLRAGTITELRSHGESSAATSLALHACRRVQEAFSGEWCAYLDSGGTLYGPGVASLGVALSRLLVIKPSTERELARCAVQVAQSHLASLLVVDARFVDAPRAPSTRAFESSGLGCLDPGRLDPALWRQTLRRMSSLLLGFDIHVLLLTNARSPFELTLPVSTRIELHRRSRVSVEAKVDRDRQGRLQSVAHIVWPLHSQPSFGAAESKASSE